MSGGIGRQRAPSKLIGEFMRKARTDRKWTQARLAAKAGVTRETVYRLEGGRMPTGDVMMRLCDALDVDRSQLDLEGRETDHIRLHPDITLLRERRRMRRLTLSDCADAAGVSSSTLSRFERGVETSRKLAEFDARGRPVRMTNAGLARKLGFETAKALDLYWRTGRG